MWSVSLMDLRAAGCFKAVSTSVAEEEAFLSRSFSSRGSCIFPGDRGSESALEVLLGGHGGEEAGAGIECLPGPLRPGSPPWLASACPWLCMTRGASASRPRSWEVVSLTGCSEPGPGWPCGGLMPS